MARFKPKGRQKVGQRGRPKGARKKAPPPMQIAQELAQQKRILDNRIRDLLEEIRQSGKPCLDREILAKYRKIGRMAGLIRKIDREIGGKAPNARFGTTKARKKRKK